MSGVRWVTSSERAGRSKKKILLLDADLRRDPSTLIFGSGLPFAGQSRTEGLGRIGKRRERFPVSFCARFDDMGCSKLSKEGSPRASFSRRRGLPKAGSRTKHHASALHLEASARAAFREKSREAPSSLWAASSQLLDVTAFPALEKGRPKNRRNPARKKSGKKKAAQSLARGSADDAARWHGSFETRTAGTPARGSSRFKASVVSQETSAMSEGGTAVRGVPVRQIQLQKSMIDG